MAAETHISFRNSRQLQKLISVVVDRIVIILLSLYSNICLNQRIFEMYK